MFSIGLYTIALLAYVNRLFTFLEIAALLLSVLALFYCL